jgi:hypothetical protein
MASIKRIAFLIALSPAFLILSCPASSAEWRSPADAKEFSLLEGRTLERGLSKRRRAELFFLWGQELASQARSGALPEGKSAAEFIEAAVGAFEKVVDLDSVLVDESRFNLEVLWREQGQSGQSQDGKQDQQGNDDRQGGKDQQSGQNQQEQRDKQDQQGNSDRRDQKAGQGKDDAEEGQSADEGERGEEKDLSGLVRDKAGEKDLDSALKAELQRKAQRQEAQAGGIRPVEKDW